jgi:hypothetical protein
MTASKPVILMFMHINTAPLGLQINQFVDRSDPEVGTLTQTQAIQIGFASTNNDTEEHQCSGQVRWPFSSDRRAVIRL